MTLLGDLYRRLTEQYGEYGKGRVKALQRHLERLESDNLKLKDDNDRQSVEIRILKTRIAVLKNDLAHCDRQIEHLRSNNN